MTIAEKMINAFSNLPKNRRGYVDNSCLYAWVRTVIAEKTDVRLIEQTVNVLSYEDYSFAITEEYEYVFADGSKLRLISDDYCDSPSAYIP